MSEYTRVQVKDLTLGTLMCDRSICLSIEKNYNTDYLGSHKVTFVSKDGRIFIRYLMRSYEVVVASLAPGEICSNVSKT